MSTGKFMFMLWVHIPLYLRLFLYLYVIYVYVIFKHVLHQRYLCAKPAWHICGFHSASNPSVTPGF